MPDCFGEEIVLWSARLMVLFYVTGVGIDIAAGGRGRQARRLVRWFWTVGCSLLLLHMAAAFQFSHGWSHRAAYEHTARQTADVVGISWGGGLYVNYAFAALWVADAARMWRGSFVGDVRAWFWVVHGLFAFVMINATVVFGPAYWKWIAPAAIAGLLLLWWRAERVRRISAG